MSTVAPLIDSVEDIWPDGAPPDAVLDQLVQASHLLGENRAVSNFGGGNTSAKGVAADHTGRDISVMWVKGSGSDLATMAPEHFTGLKLDEVLPLIEHPIGWGLGRPAIIGRVDQWGDGAHGASSCSVSRSRATRPA